jgi:hypothetical protein
MTVQIQDPHTWAKSNSYSLMPQSNSKFTTVAFQGNPVGVLTQIGDYFEFKQLDQVANPEDVGEIGSEEPINPNADVPHGHYDPSVPYLGAGNPGTGYPLLSDGQNPNAIKGGIDTSLCRSLDKLALASSSTGMLSQSFGLGLNPIPLDKLAQGTNELPLSAQISGTGHSERILDCNYWLPYAAEHYDISRDIRDYILVPIPAIFSGLPNTNGDSLSLREMLSFKPEYGMQMYKTFKGQPTHQEHDNKNLLKAKGVILESFLRPIKFNPNYYKIVLLMAFDRTKDSLLVDQILTRQQNAYSVGFYYTSYSCSICNQVVGKGINLSPCKHTQMGRPTYKQADGRLAFRKCHDAKGFECSVVNTPAFVSAIGPHLLDPRKL